MKTNRFIETDDSFYKISKNKTLPSNKGGPGSGRHPGSENNFEVNMGNVDKYISDTSDLNENGEIPNVIPECTESDRQAIGDVAENGLFELEESLNLSKELEKETIDLGDLTSIMENIDAEHLKETAEAIKNGKLQLDKTAEKIIVVKVGSHDVLLGGNHRCAVMALSNVNKITLYTINIKDIPAMYKKSFQYKLYNTPDRKAALWKKFDAEATSYEPLFKRVAVKFFRDACAKVIDKLEANGIKVKSNLGSMNLNSRQRWLGEHKDRLDEFLPRLSDLKSKLKDALKPALLSVLKSAAQNQIHDLAGIAPKKTKDIEAEEEMEFDLNDPRVVKWIGDRLDDTSETTAQTTIDATRASLRTDFENGEPLLKMSEHLREYFTGAETWRANLIARTEATAATTQASLEAVEQMDLGDSVGKGWLTENDPKVREDHAAAGERYSDGYDGDTDNIMGVDDEFVVGSDKMVAPGNGDDADENCNCRCGIFWIVINKGG